MKKVILVLDAGYPTAPAKLPYIVAEGVWVEYMNEHIISSTLSDYAWNKASEYHNSYKYTAQWDDIEYYFEEYDVTHHGTIEDSAWREIK